MSVKQSIIDNQKEIIENLPTQELKDEFVANLDKLEEPEAPSMEKLVAEAQEPECITKELFEAVKSEVERDDSVPVMTATEQEAAIAENLKLVPTEENIA